MCANNGPHAVVFRRMEARIIEVRKVCIEGEHWPACEVDPTHCYSTFFTEKSEQPIGAVLRAIADALHPEYEQSPSWTIIVKHWPHGLPVATN